MLKPWIEVKSGPTMNPESCDRSVKFSYVSNFPYCINLFPGKYILEVWGASGGNASLKYSGETIAVNQGIGGHGGYSKGVISLNKVTKCFLYVGQPGMAVPGTNLNHQGTFGGGDGVFTMQGVSNGVTGGGASDIRIGIDDFDHRIIVGGGGGGASGGDQSIQHPGGNAGGIIGETGGSDMDIAYYATGGKQEYGGSYMCYFGNHGEMGNYGQGGRAYNTGGVGNYGGGGGGGWYGGCGGGHRVAGGGGSSFVLSQNAKLPLLYPFNQSYHLKDTVMIGGNEIMPSPVIPRSFTNKTTHWDGGFIIITNTFHQKPSIKRPFFWILFCRIALVNQFSG